MQGTASAPTLPNARHTRISKLSSLPSDKFFFISHSSFKREISKRWAFVTAQRLRTAALSDQSQPSVVILNETTASLE